MMFNRSFCKCNNTTLPKTIMCISSNDIMCNNEQIYSYKEYNITGMN